MKSASNHDVMVELIQAMMAEGEPAAMILNELQDAHGARLRFIHGTYELRLDGIAATCTAGGNGLLQAWLRAVARRAGK